MVKIISLNPDKRKAGKATLRAAQLMKKYNPSVGVIYSRPKITPHQVTGSA